MTVMKTYHKELATESCSAASQNTVTIHTYIYTYTHIRTLVKTQVHIHKYT